MVAFIQVQIDIVIIQIIEAETLLFIPSKHCGSCIHIVILREFAVRPMSSMVGLERLPDLGAFLGARYLKESDARRRIWAAVAMAAGVIALALG